MTAIVVREHEPRERVLDTDDGPILITLFSGDYIDVGELRIDVTAFKDGGVRLRIVGRTGDNPA